jgi:hypothetical protein
LVAEGKKLCGCVFEQIIDFFAPGGQGALFEKIAPWTVKHPQKLLINFIRLRVMTRHHD